MARCRTTKVAGWNAYEPGELAMAGSEQRRRDFYGQLQKEGTWSNCMRSGHWRWLNPSCGSQPRGRGDVMAINRGRSTLDLMRRD